MNVGCVQPSYLPWKGYFHIIQKSDIFVFHDNIQYDKQSWRNRNMIKTAHGKQWLTVPVKLKDNWQKNICDVEIDNSQKWRPRHLNMLRQHYAHAPFFKRYIGFFADVYHSQWNNLSDLDIYLTKEIAAMFGLKTRFIKASELPIQGRKTERLIQMCACLKAKKYISGPSGGNYIEPERFRENNVQLEYMEYIYPEHPQGHGDFDHFVSIIDLLFNCGESAPNYIWGETNISIH